MNGSLIKNKDTWVYVFAPGDRSVGISSSEAEVKLPSYILETMELEEIREILAEAFSTLFDDGATKVIFGFEDEEGEL